MNFNINSTFSKWSDKTMSLWHGKRFMFKFVVPLHPAGLKCFCSKVLKKTKNTFTNHNHNHNQNRRHNDTIYRTPVCHLILPSSIESACINHASDLMDSNRCQMEIQFNETHIDLCEWCSECRECRECHDLAHNKNESQSQSQSQCSSIYRFYIAKCTFSWFNFNYHCIRAISIWIFGLLDFHPKSNFQLDLRLHSPQCLQSKSTEESVF